MSFSALLYDAADQGPLPPKQHRTRLDANAIKPGGTTQAVIVHNLSTHGLLAEAYQPLPDDHPVVFDIPGLGPVTARISWRGDNLYGCEFERPLSAAAVQRKVSGEKVVWGAFGPRPAQVGDGPSVRGPSAPIPSANAALFGSPSIAFEDVGARWPIQLRVAAITVTALLCWLIPGLVLYAIAT
jgi:hypothetical protein